MIPPGVAIWNLIWLCLTRSEIWSPFGPYGSYKSIHSFGAHTRRESGGGKRPPRWRPRPHTTKPPNINLEIDIEPKAMKYHKKFQKYPKDINNGYLIILKRNACTNMGTGILKCREKRRHGCRYRLFHSQNTYTPVPWLIFLRTWCHPQRPLPSPSTH